MKQSFLMVVLCVALAATLGAQEKPITISVFSTENMTIPPDDNKIYKLMQEKLQITLAVSLHAATDNLRRQLIPKTVKWSVAEIIAACREYVQQTGRRVTFEYCLLRGVNDGTAEARELARLLVGLNCHVNLIPYNPVKGLDFRDSSRRQVGAFREILSSAGIQVTQRVQRGSDIDAACGQLRRRINSA